MVTIFLEVCPYVMEMVVHAMCSVQTRMTVLIQGYVLLENMQYANKDSNTSCELILIFMYKFT
jgi:hypothetical protein